MVVQSECRLGGTYRFANQADRHAFHRSRWRSLWGGCGRKRLPVAVGDAQSRGSFCARSAPAIGLYPAHLLDQHNSRRGVYGIPGEQRDRASRHAIACDSHDLARRRVCPALGGVSIDAIPNTQPQHLDYVEGPAQREFHNNHIGAIYPRVGDRSLRFGFQLARFGGVHRFPDVCAQYNHSINDGANSSGFMAGVRTTVLCEAWKSGRRSWAARADSRHGDYSQSSDGRWRICIGTDNLCCRQGLRSA